MGQSIKVTLIVAPPPGVAQKWALAYKTSVDGACAVVCMAGSGYNMADVGVPLLTPAAKKYNLAASQVGLLHASVTTEAAYLKLLASLEAEGVLNLLWLVNSKAPSTNWPPSAAALHAIYTCDANGQATSVYSELGEPVMARVLARIAPASPMRPYAAPSTRKGHYGSKGFADKAGKGDPDRAPWNGVALSGTVAVTRAARGVCPLKEP